MARKYSPAVQSGHTGRVVPSVLEPVEAFEHDGKALLGPRIPHDPAHEGIRVQEGTGGPYGPGGGPEAARTASASSA